MTETDAVRALAALAQSARLRIFRALVGVGSGGLTPSQLSSDLGCPPTALSFHLKALLQAGLISQQRNGRHLIYRAEFAAMNTLLGFLTDHCCQGEACELLTSPVRNTCG